MSTDAVESIFSSLVADRGGASQFDQTQLQIGRRVAQMLADDSDRISTQALGALMGLLPERPAKGEVAYDLSKLTAAEFAALDKLTAKAAGLLPPTPEKVRRVPRRSARAWNGDDLVLLLDQLEAEIENGRRENWRQPYRLTDDDMRVLRNALGGVLSLVAQPIDIYRAEIEEVAARLAEQRRPVVDEIEPEPAPAPPRSNVVSINMPRGQF